MHLEAAVSAESVHGRNASFLGVLSVECCFRCSLCSEVGCPVGCPVVPWQVQIPWTSQSQPSQAAGCVCRESEVATQPLLHLKHPCSSWGATAAVVLPFGVPQFAPLHKAKGSAAATATPQLLPGSLEAAEAGETGRGLCLRDCWGCSTREICGFGGFQDVLVWGSQAGSHIMGCHIRLCLL